MLLRSGKPVFNGDQVLLKKLIPTYRYPLAGLLFIGLLALLTLLRPPAESRPHPLTAALDRLSLALHLANQAITPPAYAREVGSPLGQSCNDEGSGGDVAPVTDYIYTTQLVSNTSPQVGQEFFYVLKIYMSGLPWSPLSTDYNSDVAIWDALPAGLEPTGPVILYPSDAGVVSVGTVSGSSVVSGTVYFYNRWSNYTITAYVPVRVGSSVSPGVTLTNDATFTITPRNTSCPSASAPSSRSITVQSSRPLTKTVTPLFNVPYHGLVTYTLVLSNPTATNDPTAALTDTLPAQVDFARWVGSPPAGAAVNNDEITWNGTLAGSTAITFTFQATHTGAHAETVSNTAQYSTTGQTGGVSDAFVVADCSPALTVQNNADSGTDSLRQHISDVCSGGTIDFANDMTIYLNSYLNIGRDMTITGHSHAVTISGDSGNDGDSDVQVFFIPYYRTVTLTHLSIISGASTSINSYGGISNNIGSKLTIQNSTISGNSGSYSGGIWNDGEMIVQNSTISGNSAGYNGGGIFNQGTLDVQNSTLSGNSANREGGGIYNVGTLTVQNSTLSGNSGRYGGAINMASGTFHLDNSTLSGNIATYTTYGGSAIYQDSSISAIDINNSTIVSNTANLTSDQSGILLRTGSLTLKNSIVAYNNNTYNFYNQGGTFTSKGFNLANNWNGLSVQSTDRTGDPLLGQLADNGGTTLTHALLPGSPAIDAGSDCLSTDQRGIARPQGAACDIGAFELASVILSLGKTVTPTASTPYHGLVTYTLVLSNTGADSDPAVILTDTLPTQLDFAGWVGTPPAGAGASNDQITWSGTLSGNTTITFTFQATQTGAYAETITNTAEFSATGQSGRTEAAFTVVGMPWHLIYLPLVVKNTP